MRVAREGLQTRLWGRALVLCAVLLAACGGGQISRPAQTTLDANLTQRTESAHFVFHYSSGDSVQIDHQEQYYAWLVPQLAVQPPQRIDYYKYRDRTQMKAVTGRDANAWADPPVFAFHSILPFDNHETVHVITALVGRPSDFFNEGIAVAMQVDPATQNPYPMWASQPVHSWAASFRTQGRLPRVLDIVETDPFRRMSDSESYPIAGSFLRFLIDRHGIAKVLEFFRPGSREESAAVASARFQQVFGVALTDADQAWRDFLAQWQP